MKMSGRALVVCLSALTVLTASTSEAFASIKSDHSGLPTHYRTINLGTLGGTYGSATALNDRGDVVGYSTIGTAGFILHPFLWKNGVMTDLGLLDSAGTTGTATAVNDSDEVVGSSDVPGQPRSVFHAFLWKDGHMTDLGTLSGSASTSSYAAAINDRGQVTGLSYTADGQPHAFLWQDGHMADLGALGGSGQVTDINERGQVVGGMTVGTGTHAFLKTRRTVTDLGVLSGDYSVATALNRRGWVVGFSLDNAGYDAAFLWHDGTMSALPNLPGSASEATAINDDGVALGSAIPPSGQFIPVLWYKGSVIDLTTRGISKTGFNAPAVTDINNCDQMVGTQYFTDGVPSPALYLPTDR